MFSDFRLLIGTALFVQSSGLFIAIGLNPSLADNQGFMVLATAVIVTGWVGGAVAFAFAAGIESGRNAVNLGKALDLSKEKIPPTENNDAGTSSAKSDL